MKSDAKQEISTIITSLDDLNDAFSKGNIKSVAHGNSRITLLQKGLEALADAYDFPADVRYISTGEFTFNGNRGKHKESPCAPFGKELANWLNTIPTRTGLEPKQGYVLPESGWLWINHFDAERLLRAVHAEKN